jgi:flagellar basal-body rod protein FlgF
MSETMAVLEAAMRADAEVLRIVGQNVANAEVTAYRRQVPVQAAHFDQLVEAAGHEQVQSNLPPQTGAVLDVRAGTLRQTGEPLHLAIEGSGFFELAAPGGPLFTRRGDLRVSADGMLTSASGHALLGGGGPIRVDTALPAIDADGTVHINGEAVDQLRIVHFADPAKLRYIGDGLYASSEDLPATQAGHSTVRQGALETSNVTPVAEMVQLMETMRHFEAAQRLVRGHDEMMQKAISELGRVR